MAHDEIPYSCFKLLQSLDAVGIVQLLDGGSCPIPVSELIEAGTYSQEAEFLCRADGLVRADRDGGVDYLTLTPYGAEALARYRLQAAGGARLADKTPSDAAPECTAGPAGKPKTRKTVAEYNLEARKYLRTHPDAGPRELQAALGCGTGTVYNLPAYQALAAERKKGRKPKAVSLTKPMADTATKADGELAKLVREQQRDARTYKVSSRERL